MDILIDTVTNDALWVNGPLRKSETSQPYTQTVAQRLKIRLLTFQNEYFWDTSYGVPYFQRLLGQKQVSKASIDLIFQQQILLESGVKEIVTFSSTFSNRIYSLTFSVRVVDGTITSPISIVPIN